MGHRVYVCGSVNGENYTMQLAW